VKAEMEMGGYRLLCPFCNSDNRATRMPSGVGGGCPAVSSRTSYW